MAPRGGLEHKHIRDTGINKHEKTQWAKWSHRQTDAADWAQLPFRASHPAASGSGLQEMYASTGQRSPSCTDYGCTDSGFPVPGLTQQQREVVWGCEFARAHACQVLSVKRRVVNFNELGVDSGAERRSASALPPLSFLETGWQRPRAAFIYHCLRLPYALTSNPCSFKVHVYFSK